MEIRLARIEDAESLAYTIADVENSGYMLFGPGERELTIEDTKRVITILSKEPNAIIVAVENEAVVGYIFIQGEKPSRVKHRATVAVVGVHSSARKKGVAQKMLTYVDELARERQIKRLQICVIANNEPAVNLYKKMGFEQEGIYKNALLIEENFVDELVLAKQL